MEHFLVIYPEEINADKGYISVIENDGKIEIEVGVLSQNNQKDDAYSVLLNKEQLHSIIGTLLHVQSKLRK